ncbi:MAG: VCBS repeat-containing protein [Alphaproteobacteria bacterium]|nr:VCBS repeat-containing protein [Alphaproteobacteria bacterium]
MSVLLLSLLACKGTPELPPVTGPRVQVTDVPDPLAPCGDATIELTLASPLDGVRSIEWDLGGAFGSSPLDGSGTTRTFDLPAQAIADSCNLPTCQLSMELVIEAPPAKYRFEHDVVVLTDTDPTITIDGADPATLPSVLYATTERFEAELELVATAPERMYVNAAACIANQADHDCVRVPMAYDGGGDWVVDATELTTCIDGQLKEGWQLQLEVGVGHCSAPLAVYPLDLRFLEEDCDGDGLIARTDADGDCDDLDAESAASLGEWVFPDLDEDGFGAEGDPGAYQCPLDPPPATPVSSSSDDCDDTDPTFYPLAPDDQCDNLDQNCNISWDDDAAVVFLYPDDDGDGWGLNDGFLSTVVTVCELPYPGWGLPEDCDETGPNAAQIHPGQMEDPATPYDDNCDLSTACGADCDTATELLVASGDGIVAIDDPLALPPTFTTLRTWASVPDAMEYLDLDGNGLLDALLVYPTSTVVEWDLASPSGGNETLAAVGGGGVTVGDFDQDGVQDALVGSDGSATIWWGGASPLASTDLGPGDIVDQGDFDLDGCVDLVVVDSEDAGAYDTTSAVHFGTPDGFGACSRSFVMATFATSGPRAVAIGDLDGVAGPELAVASERSGTTGAPVDSTASLVVQLLTRVPTLATVPVTGAVQVDISGDRRVAFAHQPNTANEGVSVWELDTGLYTRLDELPGTNVTALLWYPLDNTGTAEDLVVLTDGAGQSDRLFFDGDPALAHFLGFDIPSYGARVVALPEGYGYRELLFVGRHPDGAGLDHSRYYLFSQQNAPVEFLITADSAFAPYAAFTPSDFPAPFPTQALP